jgi:phosphoglycerate dehydrogenase-like enzyme
MNVMIATPIEAELVERIRSVDPSNRIIWEPALLPEPRYPSDHRGEPEFARDAAGQARWNTMLAEAEILLGIPGEDAVQLADTVARAPHLRWVQCMYAGAGEQVRAAELSHSDLERVAFTTSAGVHGTMLAEFFFMGLLALRKDLRRLERLREKQQWAHWAMGELDGSTLAVIGMGAIGKAIAKLGRAFGMRVIAVTRDGKPIPGIAATYSTHHLHDALPLADAVVVTLPATDQTRGLIDRAAFATMKSSAIFGNVGRAAVADQAALVEALKNETIGGAVLDVFEPEPLPAGDPLWTLTNVIISPHTAALSARENERVVDIFRENLERFANGQPLRNLIHATEFY